ncbi:hypothetical protein ACFQ6U_11550 [Streptomyces sp. NPDC056465]|uniref:hypothetical protein n=1 Tax=unclassified Streptomyces TaxID=2593676 RepID=UPI0035E07513
MSGPAAAWPRPGLGRALRRRFRGDGKAELFVGAAGENNSTGAVWVLPGGTSGPTAAGSRLFTASSVGLTQQSSTLLGGNGPLWVI